MFDSIPISLAGDLKSMAILSENCSKIVCATDEKLHIIELVAPAYLGQKPSRILLICDQKEAHE